jgi:ABC-type thiamine transport system substrate-binding protein
MSGHKIMSSSSQVVQLDSIDRAILNELQADGRLSNQALALKFIDMSLSESAQTCFANELRYTPTNSKAVLTPDVAATVAYGQAAMKDLFRFDAPTIEANRAGWVERWSKTIAR